MTSHCNISMQIEGEVSQVREEVRRTRDRTSVARQQGTSAYRQDSQVQKPLRSPISSLPSNTAEVLRSRGDSRAARRSAEYLRSPSPVRYESIIPSIASNTEDLRAASTRDNTRNAAESKSSAELARFCNGLLLSRNR